MLGSWRVSQKWVRVVLKSLWLSGDVTCGSRNLWRALNDLMNNQQSPDSSLQDIMFSCSFSITGSVSVWTWTLDRDSFWAAADQVRLLIPNLKPTEPVWPDSVKQLSVCSQSSSPTYCNCWQFDHSTKQPYKQHTQVMLPPVLQSDWLLSGPGCVRDMTHEPIGGQSWLRCCKWNKKANISSVKTLWACERIANDELCMKLHANVLWLKTFDLNLYLFFTDVSFKIS